MVAAVFQFLVYTAIALAAAGSFGFHTPILVALALVSAAGMVAFVWRSVRFVASLVAVGGLIVTGAHYSDGWLHGLYTVVESVAVVLITAIGLCVIARRFGRG